MLARRELSATAIRTRLEARGFAAADIEAAMARLIASGAIDDRRVARAYVRTAVNVKGRGRLRVLRELHQIGIAKDVAADAIGEVFGELDERALIARALQRKLRGRAAIPDRNQRARLYQYLVRQGFSPAGVIAALRGMSGGQPTSGAGEN